jgi:hypothetical protein
MSLSYLDHHHPHRQPIAPLDPAAPKAPRFFCANSFQEAQGPARAFLASVTFCARCARAYSRLHEALGTTLFRDDDPLALVWAFDAEDRNPCTAQVVAACIVLFGRDREPARIH